MAKYGVYQGRVKRRSGYVTKGTGSSTVRKRRPTTYTRGGKEWKLKELERQTKKNVQKVNERLKSLSKRYKKGTWASKKLANRLDSSTLKVWKNGRIKLRDNLNTTQLRAVNKATQQFLKSSTSTKTGINKRIESVKGGIREFLSEPGRDITGEDAEFFYNMLNDKDFTSIAEEDYASTLWACIDDAIEFNDDIDNFISRLSNYMGIDMQDLDIKNKAIRLYQKYIL